MKKIIFSLVMTVCASTCFAEGESAGVRKAYLELKEFMQESLHLSKEELRDARKAKDLAVENGMKAEDFWISFAKEKGIELPENWVATFNALKYEGSIRHFIRSAFHFSKEEWKQVKKEIAESVNQGIPAEEYLSKIAKEKGIVLPENFVLELQSKIREKMTHFKSKKSES